MKIRKQVKNSPKLPTSVPTSMTVGRYIDQLDGKKLRCSDVTMITNRSSHMPTFTRIDTTNSAATFCLMRRAHSNCGAITLHATMVQKHHAYGPVARFRNV